MPENHQLFELLARLDALADMGMLPPEVSQGITTNLNQHYSLRDYQIEAFKRFDFYIHQYPQRVRPSHLLFHMATGSGKTLIMAGCILYLYQLGYRKFVFFVNSTNIIQKTRDNFLNPLSTKFLFSDNIQFGDKQVKVREVENFQGGNEEDINIHFTTIQGLHSRMNTPHENSVSYEDFEDKKIVFISDEAHHMNVDTNRFAGRQMTLAEQEESVSWESTVMRIFKANLENLLLEFTATVDFSEQALVDKYRDKLLIDYPLKRFYLDKYSKEVNVLQINMDRLDRALVALILSQYRYLLFAEYGLLIKPVVMFKANYVNPPSQPDEDKVVSSEFRSAFNQMLETLSAADLMRIRGMPGENIVVKKAFQYFESRGTSLENLVMQLKEGFSDAKCISVDSSQDKESTQVVVNTLESPENPYRAVFAVQALNEGWDVLNLFDIVRLYDTRDAKQGKPGKTTMSEAQLIGRGARYCPFQIEAHQSLDQRKYDSDLEHPLRICEELYYHSKYNPQYINELKTALDEIGIQMRSNVHRELKLKPEFKDSQFYRAGSVYVNEAIENKNETIFRLPDHIRNKAFSYKLHTGYASQTQLVISNGGRALAETQTEAHPLKWFGDRVIRKATQKLKFYEFANLRRYFPHLHSMSEFIKSENYLANLQVELKGIATQFAHLHPDDKLKICVDVLDRLSEAIRIGHVEKFGSKVFKPRAVKEVFKDKILNYTLSDEGEAEIGFPMGFPKNPDNYLDLSQEDWYAFNENYGTSEEKKLVKYIKSVYVNIKSRYDEIYLVRNERHFKLYNFSDGRIVEPDFVLFLKEKEQGKQTIYQLFIEPKGSHLLETDRWKEVFFEEIEREFEIQTLFENQEVRIFGLPFYNHEHQNIFSQKLDQAVNR